MISYENLQKVNAPFAEQFKTAFEKVLHSGWFILGEHVSHFEGDFATYLGAAHCAGVASGVDALTIALKALNLPAGSEVIVPSNTYIAVIMAVINAGYKPVLVEPDLATYNIDPGRIEEGVSPSTRAVIAVHLYGKACSMDKIVSICRKHDLKLIEDCAQSHGAKYKSKMSGTFGDFGAFSFYPTKNLGALGDGGALVTGNAALDQSVRKLRNYGATQKNDHQVVGFNSRLDEVQAAFLSIKLKRLDHINTHKKKLAGLYLQHLKTDFIKPKTDADHEDIYHIFNIRHPKRDQLKAFLERNGIETAIHYPVPPHRQTAIEGLLPRSFPVSEEIHRTTLSLPISYGHTEDEIMRVVEVMNRF